MAIASKRTPEEGLHVNTITTIIAILFTHVAFFFFTCYAFLAITDTLRTILHEGKVSLRTQYTIESLFTTIKNNFEGHQGVPPELDIVEENDQIIHDVELDMKINLQEDKSKTTHQSSH